MNQLTPEDIKSLKNSLLNYPKDELTLENQKEYEEVVNSLLNTLQVSSNPCSIIELMQKRFAKMQQQYSTKV
jgi:hypothetical protein